MPYRVLLAALVLGASGGCARPRGGVDDIRHVVVAVIDGVRMEESFAEGTLAAGGVPSESVLTQVRQELVPEGALVRPAYTTGIPITAPGHCALTTGRRVPIGNYPAEGGVGYYVPDVPTLFETSSGQGRGWLVGNSGLMFAAGQSAWPGMGGELGAVLDYLTEDATTDAPIDDDAVVLDETLRILRQARPPLIVANLHAMDRAGHYGEVGEYLDRVRHVDQPLVDFWREIRRDPELASNTLVLVVSDHGRHADTGNDEEWRGHGDSCRGCREIPMLWLGPGVRAGAELSGTHTLEDAAATIAWVLDAPLPYGEGRVLAEVFETPTDPAGPVGEEEVAAAGELVAWRHWVDEEGRRSEVVVDGEPWSDPARLLAEAPVVASSAGGDVVCWRELEWGVAEGATSLPWRARCRFRPPGGAWVEMGWPEEEVWPLWEAALSVDGDGTVWVASSTNTTGTVADASIEEYVRVFAWRADQGWITSAAASDRVSYASHLSLARTPDGALVATSTSDPDDDDGRNGRRVQVWAVDGDPAAPTWALRYAGTDQADAEGGLWARRELPALAPGGTALAMIGYGPEGTTVLVSTRSGRDWSALARMDPTGRVLPGVRPAWVAGAVFWARLDADEQVEVCRATPGAAPTCAPAGGRYLSGLAPTDTGVWVGRSSGHGVWERARIEVP